MPLILNILVDKTIYWEENRIFLEAKTIHYLMTLFKMHISSIFEFKLRTIRVSLLLHFYITGTNNSCYE